LETKIEYQLSSEMAEKLAVEQAMIQLTAIRKNRWGFPIILGILFAGLFAGGCGSTVIAGKDVSQIAEGVGALIGFCCGFGGGYFFQSAVRSNVARRVRQRSRAMQQKLGATKTVSWDAETLVISSPMWQTQINWQVIDELKNGEIGIHLFSGDQVIWGIPKAAIPQSISQDELIKTWQSYFSKPPKLT
jgi:hypothetical protein